MSFKLYICINKYINNIYMCMYIGTYLINK